MSDKNTGEALEAIFRVASPRQVAFSFADAVKNAPSSKHLRHHYFEQLAFKLVCEKRIDDAIESFRLATEALPSSDRYVELARFLAKHGKEEEALESVDHALRINPKNYEAEWEYIEVLIHFGKPIDALLVMDERLKAKPNSKRIRSDRNILIHKIKELFGENTIDGYNDLLEKNASQNIFVKEDLLINDPNITALVAGLPERLRNAAAKGIEAVLIAARAERDALQTHFSSESAKATQDLRDKGVEPIRPPKQIVWRQLDASEKRSAVAHAETNLWADRNVDDARSVFEWIRDTYATWIPGLTQAELKGDPGLWNELQGRLSDARFGREKIPEWFYLGEVAGQKIPMVPSSKDAKLLGLSAEELLALGKRRQRDRALKATQRKRRSSNQPAGPM